MTIDSLKDMPLRSKLRLINLVTVSLSFLVLMLVLVVHTWYSGRQAAEEESRARAQVVANNVAPALMFSDAKAAAEVLGSLRFAPEVLAAVAFDQNGRRFSHYAAPLPAQPGTAVPERLDYVEGSHFEEGHLDVVVPIRSEAGRLGDLLLIIDLGPVTQRMLAYSGILVGAALIALLLGTGLLNRLQGAITGRITNLAALMQRVSLEKDYSRRAETTGGEDEIGSLAQSFNEMLEQIQIRDGELGNELNERRHAEKKLQKLAHYDTLTHLPNRLHFNQHLEEQLAALADMDGGLGLMFVDLDNFKNVNDTFGHHAGDVLLTAVAQRLRDTLRSDDFISRLGGDEFAVVLSHVSQLGQVETIARKMVEVVSAPVDIEGNEVYVGASIGIAFAPQHAEDPAALVRHADAAMYKAKQAGKNQYAVWQPEMGEQVTRRYQLESGLRKAREQGELSLHYQPIHLLEDGRMLGVEALLRWQHPQLGPVSPAEFIPIAEDSGLIEPIGFWVIDEACRQLAIWRKRHPGLFVAINLSSRQFHNFHLAERIADSIGAHGLPPQAIELEVTESLMLEASPRVQKILQRFRELGLALALDDFGTGYSSLSYLSRYPFSKIKIDRSFVAEIGRGPQHGGIIQAIVGMGRSLHMQVVAEGVETDLQRSRLVEMGCQIGQGYYYARPLNTETLGRQLAEMAPIEAIKAEPASRLKLVS